MLYFQETKDAPKLSLAKPKNRRDSNKEQPTDIVTKEPMEKQLVKAVKDVSETLGGNVKKTESELLQKLLNPIKTSQTDESKSIADIIKGMAIDADKKQSKDLSKADQIRSFMNNGKISRDGKTGRDGKKSYVPRKLDDLTSPPQKIDLFGSEPLGVFSKELKDSVGESLTKTWDKLYERDLKLAVTHPPSNYFEQMILWTEQGKVWKFPIDNEQG